MEDVFLRVRKKTKRKTMKSRNPCYNGRCISTSLNLDDNGLASRNPCYNGRCISTKN